MFTQFFSKVFFISLILNSYALGNNKPLITITQIAPHPSLDAILKGILDELKEQQQDVEIVHEDAQGNITLASQIAQKQASLKPQVMVSITTPSTQAVYNVALKHKIPVIFSGVSDPVVAKLIDTNSKKGKGITGISDFAPLPQQLDLILKIQHKLKRLGVLYNAGEINSVSVVEKLEELAEQKGIALIKKTVTNTQEVAAVSTSFLGQVDGIYIPNDNTIISSLESVLKTVGDRLPVYASDPESVERGCLAAVTFGQYEMGRETGKLLVDVLKGTPLENIPVKQLDKTDVILNMGAAKKLSLVIPEEILNKNPKIYEANNISKIGS